MLLKQKLGPLNVDTVILSVAQLIQPCDLDGLTKQARGMLQEVKLNKRQAAARIKALLNAGYLWSRSDGFLILTPKGFNISKASLSPRDRDKFRLLLLNKLHYK